MVYLSMETGCNGTD